MKAGIIYTATTPESVEAINAEIRKKFGENLEIMNYQVMLVDGFMEGAFGIDQVDVILLAQGSMAYAEEILVERFKKPVLSSPRFGVASLAKALETKEIK